MTFASPRLLWAFPAAMLLGGGGIAGLSFWREFSQFRPSPTTPLRPAVGPVATAQDVVLGDRVHGWWVPSKNRAAVILLHGLGADRSQIAPEAGLLASGGTGVLLYDSPGYGESPGTVTWFGPEHEALRAAVAWVAQQPDVDPARIGALGFSMGSAIVAQVAAREPRLRAVALLGAFADPDAVTGEQFHRYGPLSIWPALLADRVGGMQPAAERPGDVIGQIAPRPVLIVSGDRDRQVALVHSQALFRAAGEPKSLLVVPGAGHGDYLQAAPDLYGPALVEFFRKALQH